VAKRSSKINVLGLVAAHRRTYVDARTGRPRPRDYLLLEGLPLLVAGCSIWLNVKLPSDTVLVLLTAAVIIGALLFGVMLQVSERAMTWAESSPRPSADTSRHARYLEELAANSGYASLVCILATVVYVVVTFTGAWPLRIASGIGVGLGVHLVLVLFMVLKRVFALTQDRLNRARTGASEIVPGSSGKRAS
jgi:hypothetical protein